MTTACARLDLASQDVSTEHDVEILRRIRNACKDGFAHDNTEISPQAQAAWWVVMRGRVKAWLYFTIDEGIVGYGMLRKTDDGRWWNSIAVGPEFTGRGYGSAITTDLLARHDGPVWAEVRPDNVPAMRMHHQADWELLGFVEGLAQFKSREKVVA